MYIKECTNTSKKPLSIREPGRAVLGFPELKFKMVDTVRLSGSVTPLLKGYAKWVFLKVVTLKWIRLKTLD